MLMNLLIGLTVMIRCLLLQVLRTQAGIDGCNRSGMRVERPTINFASLGYGDIVMSERYPLLGALESINGVLMIGLSTALMMAAVQRLLATPMAER